MTSPINSFSSTEGLSGPIASDNASSGATPPGASTAAAPNPSDARPAEARPAEAVTLTPEAQTSTALLEAARAADGVDDQAVLALKAAISSGSYQVPAENLAVSIVAALTETRS